jgi:hypothetical protein
MVGKQEENKKKGFHQMTPWSNSFGPIKWQSISHHQIQLALLDGKQNGFGPCH